MLYSELTEKIIKSAMNVYNTLGFGFMEKVYENSLMVELELSGLKAIQQHPVKVCYKERSVVNYLKATNKEVGILLNFGKETLEFKRKVLNL